MVFWSTLPLGYPIKITCLLELTKNYFFKPRIAFLKMIFKAIAAMSASKVACVKRDLGSTLYCILY